MKQYDRKKDKGYNKIRRKRHKSKITKLRNEINNKLIGSINNNETIVICYIQKCREKIERFHELIDTIDNEEYLDIVIDKFK